jgi:uncharacterized membrane protein
MNKIGVAKAVGSLIVSVGVSAIVGNAVKATTPYKVGRIQKACIWIGSFVLSSMVSDKASKYTEDKIEETATKVKKMVEDGELDLEPEKEKKEE